MQEAGARSTRQIRMALDLAAASADDETKRPWVGNRRIMEMEEGKKGHSRAARMKGHLRKQKTRQC